MKNFLTFALLALVPASVFAVELIQNGDFTYGPHGEYVWGEYASNGWRIIDHWTTDDPWNPGGSACLGGPFDQYSEISQQIFIPSSLPRLVLRFQVFSHGDAVETLEFRGLGVEEPVGLSAGFRHRTIELSGVPTGPLDFKVVMSCRNGTQTLAYVDNISLSDAPVPEPATLIVIGAGLAALVRRPRGQRRTRA